MKRERVKEDKNKHAIEISESLVKEPPQKKVRVANSKDVMPTLEEIHLLHDQVLQHSNFFKLQVEELLQEVSIKQSHYTLLNKWLESFTTFVKSFPKSKQFQLNKKTWVSEENLVLPFKLYEDLPELSGGTFTFMAPEKISYIGSVASKTVTKQNQIADVMLVMPKEFMGHQDMTNGKWLIKRALYLSWLGSLLKNQSAIVSSMSWTYHCSSLRPVLQIVPHGSLGKKWLIRLFPVPFDGYFQYSKISPSRCCVSSVWFYQNKEENDKSEIPTPHHNWACGVDLLMKEHHNYISEHLKNDTIIQGIKLLNVWMSQRSFNQGEGSISNHALTLYVLYLLRNRKITQQMSAYQVFRSTLLAISIGNWLESGPSLASRSDKSENPTKQQTPSLDEFNQHFSVVFIDTTGYLNLAAVTSRQTFLEVQHEAKKAIAILESSSSYLDTFDSLFIQKVQFHLNYDQLFYIKLRKKGLVRILQSLEDPNRVLLDHLGDARAASWDNVCSTLIRAFGNRINLLGMIRPDSPTWSFGTSPPILDTSLTVGLLLNPDDAFSLLTKGPSADEPESKQFREFWGEICKLRRFQDTSFHEAVLWGDSGDPVGIRRLIPGRIVSHILNAHFDIKEENIHYVASQFENVLQFSCEMGSSYGTGEEVNTAAIVAYDALSKKLRSLDLPLRVSGVQSSSEVLRHSWVFPPISKAVTPATKKAELKDELYVKLPEKGVSIPRFRYAMHVLLFLEVSGKWPDDLMAIQAIKAEFLLRVAELLRVDGLTCILFPKYLQIIWKGFIYRIEVCYRREIYLRQEDKAATIVDDLGNEESSSALEMRMETLPKLATHLNRLQSDFSCYSGSVRLIKRWVSSQMLMHHFPPLVVELLVAYLFLNSWPYSPPNTPHVAFVRFMKMASETPWKTNPVVVNLGGLFTAEEEVAIAEKFSKNRIQFPPLFVCTPCELKKGNVLGTFEEPDGEKEHLTYLLSRLSISSQWTKKTVTMPILLRLKVTATVALKYFTENLYQKDFDAMMLFRPSLEDYDAVIHLKRNMLTRRAERIHSHKPLVIQDYKLLQGERMPAVMFDPVVCYLQELRESYATHALFFHDEHGGEEIGVVWKPDVRIPQKVKITNLCGHHLINQDGAIHQVVNVDAIVADFKVLGEGLVDKIKIKNR